MTPVTGGIDAPLILAITAVLLAPLVGYLTASRKLSGKIGTSEASQLWDESKAIRDDYRARITTNDTRTALLEARVAQLEKMNNDLSRENLTLLTASAGNEATINELRRRVDECEKHNTAQRKLVAALQKSLGRETP